MTTNTLQSVPTPVHAAHFSMRLLRIPISYTDGATTNYVIGTIPAGSIVIRGTVVVTTAFNWGTNNLIDIGTAADPDGFATIMSLTTIGNIVFDEMATTNDQYVTADTILYAQMQCTGVAATTGAGWVLVEYSENLGTTANA